MNLLERRKGFRDNILKFSKGEGSPSPTKKHKKKADPSTPAVKVTPQANDKPSTPAAADSPSTEEVHAGEEEKLG